MLKLTKYGMREWLGSGIVAVIIVGAASYFGWIYHRESGWVIAGLTVAVWLAIAAFFRSPYRDVPSDSTLILAPADGMVNDIEIFAAQEVDDQIFTGEVIRIGIFLSVLDVHLNRMPADMIVRRKSYSPGRHFDARSQAASQVNEAMFIVGTAEAGGVRFPLGVKQISGAIARRIVCKAEAEAYWPRGKIYGMIKFGSRTELYLPKQENIAIAIKAGDKVRAGETAMARIIQTRENHYAS